ncbi:MAG: hypothetical protein H6Q73_49 [Firmicutes bacterium]|nr:hypothetical protein [Bacillota bacterium]
MTKIFELIVKYTPAPLCFHSYAELERQNKACK